MRVLFVLLLLSLPARAELLRILMTRDAAALVVEGERVRVKEWKGPRLVRSAEKRARVTLSVSGGRLAIDGKRTGAERVLVKADSPLRALGRTVRGALEVRVRKGALLVVNTIDMEAYVAAVLGSEMNPTWPAEALRAQAVAARTYAVERKLATGRKAAYHMDATVLSQVYQGKERESASTRDAASSTFGEVLTWQRAPARAYFHSTCGGRTASAEEAFGANAAAPYLPAVACGDDGASPKATWDLALPYQELTEKLEAAGAVKGPVQGLRVVARAESGRARRVEVATLKGKRVMPAVDLRRIVGYDRLPSLWFDAEGGTDGVLLSGRGSGHGVGLCQWGARGMAESGVAYREILARYYPGTEVRRMY